VTTLDTTYIVDLMIPAQHFELLYRGRVNSVAALTSDGRRLRFPARILRPFVERDGVRGTFAIRVGEGNRLQTIERIGRA